MSSINHPDLLPKPDPNWREKAIIFFRLKGISKSDLINGTGQVQHIKAEEIFGKQSEEGVMWFGKYVGKTLTWVQENDPNYWEWCLDNIGGFRNKITSSR